MLPSDLMTQFLDVKVSLVTSSLFLRGSLQKSQKRLFCCGDDAWGIGGRSLLILIVPTMLYITNIMRGKFSQDLGEWFITCLLLLFWLSDTGGVFAVQPQHREPLAGQAAGLASLLRSYGRFDGLFIQALSSEDSEGRHRNIIRNNRPALGAVFETTLCTRIKLRGRQSAFPLLALDYIWASERRLSFDHAVCGVMWLFMAPICLS